MMDELTLRTLIMRDFLLETDHPRLNIGPGMATLESTLPSDDVKIALDIKPKYLSGLRGIPNTHLVQGVAEKMPFRTDSLHTVSTQSTFQIIEDQFAFLNELARVLRKDGDFIITIEWRHKHDPNKQFFNFNDLTLLYEYLLANGLTETDTKHLDYDGKWYEDKEDGFSIWIIGKNTLKYHYPKLPSIE